MLDNQINELMASAIEKIRGMMDVNTVVGVPFETKDGKILIPLTKVSVGFVAGGGEYGKGKSDKEDQPMAGGSGGGVSMQPVGFLSIFGDECKLIRIDEKSKYEKLMETVPEILANITGTFKKEDENEKSK